MAGLSSPYSTGGGGTVLEHTYGAVLLTHVLTGASLHELGAPVTPTRLHFQAKSLCPVDDFVVAGTDDAGEVHAAIAVRHAPALIPSQADSVSLIASFVDALLAKWDEINTGRWRLVLAAGDLCQPARELQTLTTAAASHPSNAAFREAIGRPMYTTQQVRNRLKQLDKIMVKVKARPGTASPVEPGELTWRLLRRLYVRRLRLEPAEPHDRIDAVTRIIDHCAQRTNQSADRALSRIVELAGHYAPNAAVVDRPTLRGDLAGYLAPISPPLQAGVEDKETVDVGAVLSGPLDHLGLAADFDQAQNTASTDPAGAAALFAQVAARLVTTPYRGYAYSVRRRQAEALQNADRTDEWIGVELQIMAAALEEGMPLRANWALHRLAATSADGTPLIPADSDGPRIRAVNALGAIAGFEIDHRTTLSDITAALENFHPDDPYSLQTATYFAEHALAEGRPDLITGHHELLMSVAQSTGSSPWRARLTACLADAGDIATSWPALLTRARTEPDQIQAFLYARYGRHLAMSGRPDEALERYDSAIDHALRAEAHHDAADWLEAQNLIRARYDVDRARLENSHLMPAALRATSSGALLPHPMSRREEALAELAHGSSTPDTLEALRRYRREAIVTGAWQREEEADRLLGHFHLAKKEPQRALPHLVAAGHTEPLKALAAHLPYAPLPMPGADRVADQPAWERVAAFTAAAAASDLLPDEHARQWIDAGLAETTAATTPALGGTNPTPAAYEALARLAPAATPSQAAQLLHLVTHNLDGRTPDSFRAHDPSLATLLVALAAQPALRRSAVEQMCRALTLRLYRLADTFMQGPGWPALRTEPALVTTTCSAPAQAANNPTKANPLAALALAVVGAYDPAKPEAQRQLQHLTQLAAGPPSSDTPPNIVGSQYVAVLAAALDQSARADLARALQAGFLDTSHMALQRQDFLAALALLADHLTPDQLAPLYPSALEAARGDRDGSLGDEDTPMHPYDRSGVNWGITTLRYEGLRAAAKLATTPEQADELLILALAQLPHAPQNDTHILTNTLAILSPAPSRIPVEALASHSHPRVRVLAARMWCALPSPPTAIGASLTADPSHLVRNTMAEHLTAESHHHPLLIALSQDPRRSVRATATMKLAA